MVDLFRYQHWDLVSKRGWYYVISAVMLLIGIVFMFTNVQSKGSALNLGIDFKGGGKVGYTLADGQHFAPENDAKIIEDIRETLKKQNIENEVQVSRGTADKGDQIIVRVLLEQKEGVREGQKLDDDIATVIAPAVNKTATQYLQGATVREDSREVVSGIIKSDLINKAIGALIFGSLLIMLWIWLRYNIGGLGMRYSAAGIIALVHDLGTLVGMFAIFHNFLQVNSPFIAALLTVLGYSIHDTIVIFDRVRENIRLRKGRTFAETVNISLLETLARSVNTIVTVLLTLLALLFFGGSTLRDFVAAMLIGVTVGGYSSIFVASQLLVSWSKGKEKVILPPGEDMPVVAAPQPVAAFAGAAPQASVAAPSSSASRDDIQRAKQAGKTSKRKR